MGKYLIIPNSDFSNVAVRTVDIGNVTITVNVSNTGGGEVSGGGNYEAGSHIIITATPSAGYKFLRWNDGNTNAQREIIVGQVSATYSAEFALDLDSEWSNGFYDATTGEFIDETHGPGEQRQYVPKFCCTIKHNVPTDKTSVIVSCSDSFLFAIRLWHSNDNYLGIASWGTENTYSIENGYKIAIVVSKKPLADIIPSEVVANANVVVKYG